MSALSLLFFVICLIALAAGQDQSVLQPTSPAPAPTALAGGFGYSHIGCWNETDGYESSRGRRALAGGRYIFRKSMTTAQCLEFCFTAKNGQSMQYAGLANGRECWCNDHISELSEKLNDGSRCKYSCNGNASEVCGGSDALTLYNLTELDYKTGRAWSQFSGAAGYGTLAAVTLVIAALL